MVFQPDGLMGAQQVPHMVCGTRMTRIYRYYSTGWRVKTGKTTRRETYMTDIAATVAAMLHHPDAHRLCR